MNQEFVITTIIIVAVPVLFILVILLLAESKQKIQEDIEAEDASHKNRQVQYPCATTETTNTPPYKPMHEHSSIIDVSTIVQVLYVLAVLSLVGGFIGGFKFFIDGSDRFVDDRLKEMFFQYGCIYIASGVVSCAIFSAIAKVIELLARCANELMGISKKIK